MRTYRIALAYNKVYENYWTIHSSGKTKRIFKEWDNGNTKYIEPVSKIIKVFSKDLVEAKTAVYNISIMDNTREEKVKLLEEVWRKYNIDLKEGE